MCRNIKTLFNFEPPATDDEVRAAALQFVRKLSGFNAPSKINEAAFNRAIDEVTDSARMLLGSLTTLTCAVERPTDAGAAFFRRTAFFFFAIADSLSIAWEASPESPATAAPGRRR